MWFIYPFLTLLRISWRRSCFLITATFGCLALSCSEEKEKKVVIETPRELTSADAAPPASTVIDNKSQAPVVGTSTQSSGYSYVAAESWKSAKTTPFRLINYTFGAGGEVYLSKVRGDVLGNVNRWMNQFGQSAVPGISSLEEVKILGNTGYIAQAEGSFMGMRMTQAKENYALLAAIMKDGDDVITIKMTGPKGEVKAEYDAFIAFCTSLKTSQ